MSVARVAPPNRAGIAAVVFDFDGVIADTERLHLGAFQDVFAGRGWRLDEADYFDRYLGCDDHGLVVAYARDRRLDVPPAEIDALVDAKVRAFSRHLTSADVLFDGAADAVRALAAEFPVAIASGALRHEIAAILDAAGLLSLFQVIVAADDVTMCKPSPEPYLTAAHRLGVDPRAAVAIEDSAAGLVAARAAGMRTIALTTTSAPHLLTDADRVVATLAEVTPALVLGLSPSLP